ncbi:uncharacterized protein LOC130623235 [Hydractinia symbiolongicarpus]|uniref:uncharacterized protein LOC130623235 n=1 Tax=Hydractinia symbiolongicarpus TaxID=13093 RepID=UPI002551A18E|nr:uncharacterized protein LOC130623235 [Hydractinia symbiolongicarpus]
MKNKNKIDYEDLLNDALCYYKDPDLNIRSKIRVQYRGTKIRGKDNPWMTKEIKLKMNARDYYLRGAKRTNAEIDWSAHKRMRNNVTNAIRHAKSNFVHVFKENIHHSKQFWNQIKKCYPSKEKESPSRSFKINDFIVTDKKRIADNFCPFFSTIGSSLSKKIPSISNSTWKTPVFVDDVLPILKSIRRSKASGVDDIPSSLVKDAAEELAPPISFLINWSFKVGTFPTAEKTAKVTPLYKSSGKRNSFDNYRPISVLNVISKVIEKIACHQITDHLENNNLLSSCQYGFRRNRSTQHAVSKLVDHIRHNIDGGKYTGVLYMDFSKAFDTVNHSCLLQKLPYYGINGVELEWFSNYLFNQKQLVVYEGVYSNVEINDLRFQLTICSLLMYADDTVLYFSDKLSSNIEKLINEEAEIVQRWVNDNCLLLNLKKGKTEFVLYMVPVHPNNQIRICSRVTLLSRIRYTLPPTVAETIYKSMINPLIHYCYPLFSGLNLTWKIKFQAQQNRAKRIIGTDSAMSWPEIDLQRNRKMVTDVFKSIHSLEPIQNVQYEFIEHRINTRGNKSLLRVPRVRTEAGRKTTCYQGTLLFNKLDLPLRNEKSFIIFKRNINVVNLSLSSNLDSLSIDFVACPTLIPGFAEDLQKLSKLDPDCLNAGTAGGESRCKNGRHTNINTREGNSRKGFLANR